MVAEEAGVQSLARHLQAALTDIPVHHIAQRCMYQLIGPDVSGESPSHHST
jgi:hypothetical protein